MAVSGCTQQIYCKLVSFHVANVNDNYKLHVFCYESRFFETLTYTVRTFYNENYTLPVKLYRVCYLREVAGANNFLSVPIHHQFRIKSSIANVHWFHFKFEFYRFNWHETDKTIHFHPSENVEAAFPIAGTQTQSPSGTNSNMSQEKCPGDICMTTYVTKDGDEKDSTFGCATAQCTQPFRGGCRSTTNGSVVEVK
eukprot:NP_497519.1 Uncharacterized protein CELE_C39B5.10 [Caenorhabditis elegans]